MSQIIYGLHPVEEALRSSPLQLERILVATSRPRAALQGLLAQAKQKNVPVTITDHPTLERLAGGGVHQGVLAIVRGTYYAELEQVLSRWKEEGTPALVLLLDEIQDPQNLGSLIRTASGCGVHGVILPKDRAAGITPAVVKASAGAVAHLPIVRVVNLASTIDRLKKEGIWVYGAAPEAEEVIYRLDLRIDLAIAIGSESKGLRPLVKKKCDRLFSIPMKGPLACFNASVSAGMILYEVMRQRALSLERKSG